MSARAFSGGTAVFLRVHALDGNMAKHKKNASGDNVLREHQSCGLSRATIEGAIKAGYEA
jgi:hypothetical protein